MLKIENIAPMDIEKESFATITRELGDKVLDPEQEPIIKRVIHTTADFEYADTMYFSENAVQLAREAIRGGALIVTDTQMAYSGINKKSAAKFGCEVKCFMSDEDVAAEAKKQGVTRARISMDKGASFGDNVIFAVGNAPTALIRLRELINPVNIFPVSDGSVTYDFGVNLSGNIEIRVRGRHGVPPLPRKIETRNTELR